MENVRRVIRDPRGPVIGLGAQLLLLRAFASLLTRIVDSAPSPALGMILVAGYRSSRGVRYGGVSMSQLSFVEVPPKGAAFFVSGPRCAVVAGAKGRRVEGDPT